MRRLAMAAQSDQDGNDVDSLADDQVVLIEPLDLHDAMLVGHYTGGEVVRWEELLQAPSANRSADHRKYISLRTTLFCP